MLVEGGIVRGEGISCMSVHCQVVVTELIEWPGETCPHLTPVKGGGESCCTSYL